MTSRIEDLCKEKGIKLTENRKIIAKIISESKDHPDVDEIYKRANNITPDIGIATVYRAVKLFEELGVVAKHDFGDKGKARYEASDNDVHHDHLIDVNTGEVIEFYNQNLEDLKHKISQEMGYELLGHKLELYCRKIKT